MTLIPIKEKEEKQREEEGKELDPVTDYYPPSPMYTVSYEEDTPALVNNLVPEAAPEEKMTKDQTKEKLIEDGGDSGDNTDEDTGEDADDSDSDYIY